VRHADETNDVGIHKRREALQASRERAMIKISLDI